MSHTNSWDETTPAGTDLVSAGDDAIRRDKLDTRERAAMDHIWGSSTTHDGKHVSIRSRPLDDTPAFVTELTNTINGALLASLVDLAQNWNTGSAPSAVKINVHVVAAAAGAKLLNLQKDGVTVFYVGIDGDVSWNGKTLPTPVTQNSVGITVYQDFNISGQVAIFTGDATTLGGITVGAYGRRITIVNNTNASMTITRQDTGSAAANRFQFPGTLIQLQTACAMDFTYGVDGFWHPHVLSN